MTQNHAVTQETHVTAFVDGKQIATGALAEVLGAIKAAHDAGQGVLVFSDASARVIDLDLRGRLDEALARLEAAPARGPGRPKLGVTSREVTLLPRHWDWLASQPGGASVVLRKLVEAASKSPSEDRRLSQEVAYRFMSAMAGNLSGFEEANRALFAGDKVRFEQETEAWPPDVRDYARRQAAGAF